MLARFGRGLQAAGPLIGAYAELQQTGSYAKTAAVGVGDAVVNAGAAAAGAMVAGIISGAAEGALVGEAVGPEGAIVGAAVGAVAAWVGDNGVSDLANSIASIF